jgi:hypothetical protein
MNVWIAFHGYDYEGSDILGVYTNFEAARNKCIEEIDGDSNIKITIEGEEKFFAEGRAQSYRVSRYNVE